MNTGRGAHLSLGTSDLIFCCVGRTTLPPQQAYYFLSIAGTHSYTWIERINSGKVPYSRTQHVDRNVILTHILLTNKTKRTGKYCFYSYSNVATEGFINNYLVISQWGSPHGHRNRIHWIRNATKTMHIALLDWISRTVRAA